MDDGDLILAIDQGGTSTRAMLFDAAGRSVGQAQCAIATQRDGDRVEHDAEEVVSSVRDAVSEVLAKHGNVIAAGLATQRSSIVCWDRDSGAPLSPVLSWQDRRAAQVLHEHAPDAVTLNEITGLVASPHYGASKLRWCLDHLPAVQRAAGERRLAAGPLASFLLRRVLTPSSPCGEADPPSSPRGGSRRQSSRAEGVFLADPVNASRTLLWDVRTRDWSPPLLDAFGIPRDILPTCVPNRYSFGTLEGTGIPLTVCTGDQTAAVFASGRLDPRRAIVNIGTGAFVLAPVGELPARSRLLRSVAWDDGEHVLAVLEGTVNGAASAIASVMPDATTGDVREAADRIGNKEQSVLFINGVSGLGSPYWREEFASHFVGDGGRAQWLTAVLESILFLLQVNLELVPDLPAREITVSGGLARSDGLCRGLAALAGVPVRRSDEPEATARGLAALVAGLPPAWQSRSGSVFKAVANRALSARYNRWRAVMDGLLAAIE